MDIQHLRLEYSSKPLTEDSLKTNPIEQFSIWFEEALKSTIIEPNALALATVSAKGFPSCRMVLMKAFDISGIVFFSNIYSRKGIEISTNPTVSALFWWKELERQVRIEGRVEVLPAAEAASYFSKRPKLSQLGTRSSRQSEKIPSREYLEKEYHRLEELYKQDEIPAPQDWGGFRIIPHYYEFWQGRENRLHDRLCYVKTMDFWRIERLSP